jgi:hypothetical protein
VRRAARLPDLQQSCYCSGMPTIDRPVVDVDTLADVPAELPGPIRLCFRGPSLGGPRIREIRAALTPRGRLRLSGNRMRVSADIDPGPPEEPLIVLDMIARSDARGLERAIWSALGQVDYVVVGVDARSDEETRHVAGWLADEVREFDAAATGLTDDEWRANAIHFATARNIGRAIAAQRAPWCLVIDTDEYLERSVDLRAVVRAQPHPVDAVPVEVRLGEFTQVDNQRLARSDRRWARRSHNELDIRQLATGGPVARVVQDLSLRPEAEVARRDAQRDAGIEGMRAEAEKGDLHALFHVIKHRFKDTPPEELAPMVQDYRFRCAPHGPLGEERGFLAWSVGVLYAERRGPGAPGRLPDEVEAELWAHRAMFDGPRLDALLLLSQLAEDRGELVDALCWAEFACIITREPKHGWPEDAKLRFVRRDQLRAAVLRDEGLVGDAAE